MYAFPNIRVIKSISIRWERHAKIIYLCKNRRDHKEDLSTNNRIIPEWILQKHDVKLRTELDITHSVQDATTGLCEQVNRICVPKHTEFFDLCQNSVCSC